MDFCQYINMGKRIHSHFDYSITPPSKITFITPPINIYRPKLGTLNRRDGMVQRLWQKWSRF